MLDLTTLRFFLTHYGSVCWDIFDQIVALTLRGSNEPDLSEQGPYPIVRNYYPWHFSDLPGFNSNNQRIYPISPENLSCPLHPSRQECYRLWPETTLLEYEWRDHPSDREPQPCLAHLFIFGPWVMISVQSLPIPSLGSAIQGKHILTHLDKRAPTTRRREHVSNPCSRFWAVHDSLLARALALQGDVMIPGAYSKYSKPEWVIELEES